MSTEFSSWLQAQIGDVPLTGDVFFLAPATSSTAQFINWIQSNGVDEQHYGTSFSTVQAKMKNGRNDVMVVMPGNHTTTATLTWSNSYNHLIGASAPIMIGQRSRITTTGAAVDPLITISGSGCVFKNIMFNHEGTNATTAPRVIALSGDRNAFLNVGARHIGAASVPGTGMRIVKITSSNGENYWKNCTLGYSSVDGDSGDPIIIEYAGTSTSRDVYEDCVLDGYGAALGSFLKAGNGTTSAYTLFKRCTFFNNDLGTMEAMTQAFQIGGGNGYFLLQHCGIHGASALETSDSGLLMAIGAQATTTQEKFAAATGW
jgi:hypothetical protein